MHHCAPILPQAGGAERPRSPPGKEYAKRNTTSGGVTNLLDIKEKASYHWYHLLHILLKLIDGQNLPPGRVIHRLKTVNKFDYPNYPKNRGNDHFAPFSN